MRILWVDADQNPWTESHGWNLLSEYNLKVKQVSSLKDAKKAISAKKFDLLVIRKEFDPRDELQLLAKKTIKRQKYILISSEMKKAAFEAHSHTDLAAHQYAKVPMPPEGFVNILADLCDCTVNDLAEFAIEDTKEVEAPEASALSVSLSLSSQPDPSPSSAGSPRASQGEDVQVLHKYLRIKEEQLELAEGEKHELALENARMQKEAQEVQVKIRELQHLHDELLRKSEFLEQEKEKDRLDFQREKEELEHQSSVSIEKAKLLEQKVNEANDKYENLRIRVRKDIRKIRTNERDLEARLELTRRDSETLLQARDQRVLELQRKIDALEFDLDQVQDSRVQAQMEAERYVEKLARVARALRIAISIIEEDVTSEEELEELEPLLGGAAAMDEGSSADIVAAVAEAESAPAAGTPGEGGSNEGAPADELSPELAALANDGEPTRMLNLENLENMEGEPKTSSG